MKSVSHSQHRLVNELNKLNDGQAFSARFLLLMFVGILSVLGGLFAGAIGGYSIRILCTPPNSQAITTFTIGLLTLIGWAVSLVKANLISSLMKIGISSLLIPMLIAVILRNAEYIVQSWFIVVLAIVATTLGLVSCLISFFLTQALFTSPSNLLKTCNATLIILISATNAYLISNEVSESSILHSNLVPDVKLIAGVLVSSFFVFLSFKASSPRYHPLHHLYSLRQWSIALASWGGVSFYNLDLSGIDFTGIKIAHTDFRASNFYRTCLRNVRGLDQARVDARYFDLDSPKVQELLTIGSSKEHDFSRMNLRGAYLRDAYLQHFNFNEANLDGADLSDADLRDSTLVRAILTGADLSRAKLTGICIQDWSINDETNFSDVQCEYIYREYRNDQPTDCYPPNRKFEPGEFEALFQKLTNAVELVFRDQIDWRALSFTFEKFRLEDDDMGLELKGIEQRGDYWIVKVTHREGVSRQQVERRVHGTYDELCAMVEAQNKKINQLLGIVENQAATMHQQAEALTNLSKQPFGNNFFISGSAITNLAGSGQIEYREAANRVRGIVTNQVDPLSTWQRLINQLNNQNVATTAEIQRELIQQILLSEAERDPIFKEFLLQQGSQITLSLPNQDIAITVQGVIAQLRN